MQTLVSFAPLLGVDTMLQFGVVSGFIFLTTVIAGLGAGGGAKLSSWMIVLHFFYSTCMIAASAGVAAASIYYGYYVSVVVPLAVVTLMMQVPAMYLDRQLIDYAYAQYESIPTQAQVHVPSPASMMPYHPMFAYPVPMGQQQFVAMNSPVTPADAQANPAVWQQMAAQAAWQDRHAQTALSWYGLVQSAPIMPAVHPAFYSQREQAVAYSTLSAEAEDASAGQDY